MNNTYVIGDIHGNYKGLVQAIERSPYNPYSDKLILLGDLVDGGCDSYEVLDYLSYLKYKLHSEIILINGNHDEWFKHWINIGVNPVNWLQGQKHTAESYIRHSDRDDVKIVSDGDGSYKCNLTYLDVPVEHRQFFNIGVNYYIDEDNNCYVHGGFNRHLPINNQNFDDIYYWDRDLWAQALSYETITNPLTPLKFKMNDSFNNIFIGHTSTLNWGKTEPMFAANIINIDTGAGFNGKITIMNTKTKEYWQSDLVEELYGEPFSR